MRPLHLHAPGDPRDDRPDPHDDLPAPGEDDLLDSLKPERLGELVDDTWPDDEPVRDVLPEAASPAAVPLDLAVPDDDGTELDLVITQEAPLPTVRTDPVVLPWRSQAHVDGEPCPAVVDTSVERTRWVTERHPSGAHTARIRLVGVVVEHEVEVVSGRSELRVGRDLLRGRFWVEV